MLRGTSIAGGIVAVSFAGNPNVHVSGFALGRVQGLLPLFINDARLDKSSLVPDGSDTRSVMVDTETGDRYLASNGINCVDFLKIDVEGFDLEVLHGVRSALEASAIRVIQFEHSHWNLRSRAFLGDFYGLLEPLGYQIGKVRPNGVEFSAYHLRDEGFVGPAVIAVRSENTEIVELLRPI